MTVPLSKLAVRRTLLAIAGLNILLLLATNPDRDWGATHWRLRYLGRQLDLGLESNFAVWFASMVLLLVAAVMLLCFVLDRRADDAAAQPRAFDKALTFGWIPLALAFGLLSWDELGSLHERVEEIPWINALLPAVEPLKDKGWVGALAIPIGLVGLAMVAFGWLRVRASRAAFWMMCAGVGLYLSVPVQEDIEAMLRQRTLAAGQTWMRPMYFTAVEEGTEAFGALLFLAAGLAYARHRLGALVQAGVEKGDSVTLLIRTSHVLLFGSVLGVALLSAPAVFPDMTSADGLHGVTRNWFPVVLSAMAAAACAVAAFANRRPTPWGLLLLAAANLALSINHGSDYSWQREMLTSASLSWALPGAVGAGLLIVAGMSIVQTKIGRTRWAIAIWTVLIMLALTISPSDGVRNVLSFAGYLTLLIGVTPLLSRGRGSDILPAAPSPQTSLTLPTAQSNRAE